MILYFLIPMICILLLIHYKKVYKYSTSNIEEKLTVMPKAQTDYIGCDGTHGSSENSHRHGGCGPDSCDKGYYRSVIAGSPGAYECKQCSAGTYNNSSNHKNTQCTPCGHGKYQNLIGSTSCNNCPSNTYTQNINSTHVSQCLKCPNYYQKANTSRNGCENITCKVEFWDKKGKMLKHTIQTDINSAQYDGGVPSQYNDWQVSHADRDVYLSGDVGCMFHGHDNGKGSTPCHDYYITATNKSDYDNDEKGLRADKWGATSYIVINPTVSDTGRFPVCEQDRGKGNIFDSITDDLVTSTMR